MLKISLDNVKYQSLKNISNKKAKRSCKLPSAKTVGTVAIGLLELASLAENKVGKSARLIKELIEIFKS